MEPLCCVHVPEDVSELIFVGPEGECRARITELLDSGIYPQGLVLSSIEPQERIVRNVQYVTARSLEVTEAERA